MNSYLIITELERNMEVFPRMLVGMSRDQCLWKPHPDKWCLLEIICHLCDEEVKDFRTRVRSVLKDPLQAPPSIDPVGWVTSHRYMEEDFEKKLEQWKLERGESVNWLRSLESPHWENAYDHPQLGPLTAHLFLTNWLAHDYLHIRQITRLKYDYLSHISGEDLKYAGKWI